MSTKNKSTGLRPAKSVRPGHVAKAKSGLSYVAKGRTPGSRHWVRASDSDVKCNRYLKRTIRKLTHEAKHKESKRVRTIPQAIAVSYSKTLKKYPKCELVKRQSNTQVPKRRTGSPKRSTGTPKRSTGTPKRSTGSKSKKSKRRFLDIIFG